MVSFIVSCIKRIIKDRNNNKLIKKSIRNSVSKVKIIE